MIKLVVTDVDGTLVEDGAPYVGQDVFDVILKLREKGIQVVVASGRQWASVERAFEPVKKKIFYVADNGAYIGCHGRSLNVYSVERDVVHRLIKKARLYPDLDIIYAGENGDYLDSDNEELYRWLTEDYKFNVSRVKDLLEIQEPCLKVSIFKSQGIEEATREICEEFGEEMKIACAGDMWLDCIDKDVNKGKAVRTIQESLNISPRETMAFGDQLNDIEMLEQAYYSFAVANAREEVRRAARFQADSNVNNGVTKILKHLL